MKEDMSVLFHTVKHYTIQCFQTILIIGLVEMMRQYTQQRWNNTQTGYLLLSYGFAKETDIEAAIWRKQNYLTTVD